MAVFDILIEVPWNMLVRDFPPLLVSLTSTITSTGPPRVPFGYRTHFAHCLIRLSFYARRRWSLG